MLQPHCRDYQTGIQTLIMSLGKGHPRLEEVLALQSRLIKNLSDALEQGLTAEIEKERVQILERCNQISLDTLGTTFFELCGMDKAPMDIQSSADTEDEQPPDKLTIYFNQINALLQQGLSTTTASDEVRAAARRLTLEILPGLKGPQKGQVVRFLYDAGLITEGVGVIFLSGADLSDIDLSGIFMVEAHLAGVDLTRAHMEGAHLEWARLGEATLTGANLQRSYLVAAHLGGADLVRADLRGAYLVGANLAGAKLMGANLAGAHLEWAYLVSANLESANLAGARLRGAEMMWARSPRADLAEVDLIEANLSWAHLAWSRLRNAKYNDLTRWPEGFDPTLAKAIKVSEK